MPTTCSGKRRKNLIVFRFNESKKGDLCQGHIFSFGLSFSLGVAEAKAGGKALKDGGYVFDLAHTSLLKRAQITLGTVLEQTGQTDLPVQKTWRLNERHYGALTGLNKAETAEKHGEEQVQIWRRSFDIPPPAMEPDHPFYENIAKDPRYAEEPKPEEFPMFESLKLTIDRTLPYWNNVIVPQIKEGKKILIAAHGNSLRGIVKHLDNMSDSDIMGLNLPTGIPFIYELDENMKPLKSMQFLGDEETVRKAMESVANQGKAKKAEPAPEAPAAPAAPPAPEAPAAAPETPAPTEPAPEMPVSMVAHTVGNLKPPMEPIRVVITGAAGQIGYSLIYMVGSGYVFGQDQPIILHLLDVEPAMGVLGGVVMEIQDCAMPLVKGVVPTADPAVAFKV